MTNKTMLGNYPFDATAKTLDLSSIPNFDIRQLRYIHNRTAKRDLFLLGSDLYTADEVSGVLHFDESLVGMNNGDKFVIIYDDQADSTTNLLTAINNSVGLVKTAVDATTSAVSTAVTALNTGNVNTGNIASYTSPLAAGIVTLQGLASTGNSALGVLHEDGLNLQDLVSTANAALADLHTDVTSGTTAIVNAVNAVATAVAAVNTSIATGNSNTSTLVSQTASLSNALATLQTLAGTANTALGTLHADAGTIESLIGTGNTALAALQSLAATTNSDLAQLHTDVTSGTTSLLSSLSTLNTSISGLATLLASGNATAAAIQTAIGTANTALAAIQTSVAAGATAAGQATAHTDAAAINALIVTGNAALATLNTNVTNGTAAIVSAVNAVATAVAAVTTAVNTGNASAATIASQTASLTGALSNLQTLVATSNTDLSLLHIDLGSINTLITTGNAALAAIQTSAAAGSTAAAQATAQITLSAMQTALSAIQTSVAASATAANQVTAQASLTSMVSSLSAIQSNVATAANQVTAQSSLTAMQGYLSTISSGMATAAAQSSALTALNTLHTDLTTNATKLDTIASNITTLGTTLGGGNTIADIVTALGLKASTSDITALQTALTTIENSELTALQDMQAALGGATASPAGNTGASSSNGFLRWLRDFNFANFGTIADSVAGSLTGSYSLFSYIKLFSQNLFSDIAYTGGSTITVVDSATAAGSNTSGQTWVTGTPTANSSVEFTGLAAKQAVRAYLFGTWGGGTVQAEYANGGGGASDPYYPMIFHLAGATTGANSSTFTANTEGLGLISAVTNVRFRATAGAGLSIAVRLNTTRMSLLFRLFGATFKAGGAAAAASDTGLVTLIRDTVATTQVSGIVGSETSQNFTAAAQTFTINAPADSTRIQGARFIFNGTAGMTFGATALMPNGSTVTLGLVNRANLSVSTTISTVTAAFEADLPAGFSSVTLTSSGSPQTVTVYHAFINYRQPTAPSSITATLSGAAALADAVSNPTVASFGAYAQNFDGSQWNRVRGVSGATVTASGTISGVGTTNAATRTNYNGRGVIFYINVTAASGTTPTLTVGIRAVDNLSGSAASISGAITGNITGTGLTILMLYPGMAAVANSAINAVLPWKYAPQYVLGGVTPSFTFSVSEQVIP